MRRATTVLAAAAAVALVASPITLPAQQALHRGHALEPTGAVRIMSMAGSIMVSVWDRDSVDVTGTVGRGLTPFSGGTNAAFKFTTYEGDQDATSRSHLRVRVPRRAQLWIKTLSSSITVAAAEGELELYTIDGPIAVTGSPATLTAETMRGAVTVSGTPAWLRLRSGSGTLRLSGRAEDAALSTVSGAIRSTSWIRRGRMESVTGDIEVAGALAPRASLDIDSHAGAVRLRFQPRPSVSVTVFSLSGRITNELSEDRPSVAGSGHELTATLGDGSARLVVRTFSGPVVIGKG